MKGENDVDISYKIEKELGTIGNGSAPKMLCLVSWNNNPPKLDIRPWRNDPDRGRLPGKGITLNDFEGRLLLSALKIYFGEG